MEVETRITAMAMIILGMDDISEDPTENVPPTSESAGILKKIYLDKISNIICKDYICESKKATTIHIVLTENALRISVRGTNFIVFSCLAG